MLFGSIIRPCVLIASDEAETYGAIGLDVNKCRHIKTHIRTRCTQRFGAKYRTRLRRLIACI